MAARRLLVDVHTHLYLPRYASLLRARSAIPRIYVQDNGDERLLILNDEPSGGRPVGPEYWDRDEKLRFMDKHAIDISIVSTANPWLDFLPPSDAHTLATELNDGLEAYCATAPSITASSTLKRLYAFGLLPLVPQIPITALLSTVAQITKLQHLKGIIMGTKGLGKGLDDPDLEPVWAALADAGMVVFLHPHYGVDATAWGEQENGHVLPLALGFPFETTVATTRLILAGVLDRHPHLRLLLAHSGGALPALSSRLASCIAHDPVVARRLANTDARAYLGMLYFDAVAYGAEELGFVSDVVARAETYKGEEKLEQGRKVGSKRMLFGTDHPFFPPLSSTDKWGSVVENLDAIDGVAGWDHDDKAGVRGGNAMELFGLN